MGTKIKRESSGMFIQEHRKWIHEYRVSNTDGQGKQIFAVNKRVC